MTQETILSHDYMELHTFTKTGKITLPMIDSRINFVNLRNCSVLFTYEFPAHRIMPGTL